MPIARPALPCRRPAPCPDRNHLVDGLRAGGTGQGGGPVRRTAVERHGTETDADLGAFRRIPDRRRPIPRPGLHTAGRLHRLLRRGKLLRLRERRGRWPAPLRPHGRRSRATLRRCGIQRQFPELGGELGRRRAAAGADRRRPHRRYAHAHHPAARRALQRRQRQFRDEDAGRRRGRRCRAGPASWRLDRRCRHLELPRSHDLRNRHQWQLHGT